jgi:UDP-N-acetylglucosamine:LPS N-acetylglucosamine transferase
VRRTARLSQVDDSERVDVLLVCTSGGHLLQLWHLRAAWGGYRHAWVVGSHAGSDVRSLLHDERLFYAYSPAARSLRNLMRNLLLAERLLRRLRPRVIVTTGAAVAVPFAWLARAFGARIVYIESLARAERPSLSCRLVAPVAHRVYVQWPELLGALPSARYVGSVFAER